MAYNIFIDNAISYGYIKSDALRANSLMSNDFIQEDVHSTHGNETLVGQNQTHIIAGALRNLSANYSDASEKYGAMFIKIGQGNFNLSAIVDGDDTTWDKFVAGMGNNDTDGTNFTRIYVKDGAGYSKVSSITDLTADDKTKLDDSRLANHEYVLVYGYEFIRRNGRSSIKVPMMPNIYSVFADGNVHVMVNDDQEGWDTTQKQKLDIFEEGSSVTAPTDYYGEFKSRVDLDGWIKEQNAPGRTLIRKWNTENDKTTAKTGSIAGDYSIMGKNNTHNELYIWFDEVSGNIYLGTATNAVFVDGSYSTDENGENPYVAATGGNATIKVQPNEFHKFDVVAGENGNTLGEGQITFDNEDGDESDPTITNVECDTETGETVITLGGVDDLNQSDALPLINVTARPTVLKGIVEYHTFDPFSSEGQTISDIDYVEGIFNVDGYTKAALDALTDENRPAPSDQIEIGGEQYVYFGLSKGAVAANGSAIDDTAVFDFTDEENINSIKVNDAEVTYHLYYVPASMFRAEVILTNVHTYEQAGPTDEIMYLNNGSVDPIPGVD